MRSQEHAANKIALALILSAWIPAFWQPLWGQSPRVGVEAGKKQKQQPNLTGSQSQTDQRGTKESPVVVDVLSHPKSQDEATEAERDKDNAALVNRWMLGFTGAAAFFTGLLVIVGYRGVNAANRTLSGIQTQVETMMQAERAWLAIRPDGFVLKPCNRFDWAITNTGRTTARISEAYIRCRKYTRWDKLPAVPEYETPITLPNVPIVPNDSLKGWSYIEVPAKEPGTDDGLSAEDVVRIAGDRADLIVYGYAKYLDSFGNPHESRFCLYYAPTWKEFRFMVPASSEYHRCT